MKQTFPGTTPIYQRTWMDNMFFVLLGLAISFIRNTLQVFTRCFGINGVIVAGVALVVTQIGTVNAHTVAYGYVAEPQAGSYTFWFGTYHSGFDFTEGELQLRCGAGLSITAPFTTLSSTRPKGLVHDRNYFYDKHLERSGLGPVVAWQGVTIKNIPSPNVCEFRYVPIAKPTEVWDSRGGNGLEGIDGRSFVLDEPKKWICFKSVSNCLNACTLPFSSGAVRWPKISSDWSSVACPEQCKTPVGENAGCLQVHTDYFDEAKELFDKHLPANVVPVLPSPAELASLQAKRNVPEQSRGQYLKAFERLYNSRWKFEGQSTDEFAMMNCSLTSVETRKIHFFAPNSSQLTVSGEAFTHVRALASKPPNPDCLFDVPSKSITAVKLQYDDANGWLLRESSKTGRESVWKFEFLSENSVRTCLVNSGMRVCRLYKAAYDNIPPKGCRPPFPPECRIPFYLDGDELVEP